MYPRREQLHSMFARRLIRQQKCFRCCHKQVFVRFAYPCPVIVNTLVPTATAVAALKFVVVGVGINVFVISPSLLTSAGSGISSGDLIASLTILNLLCTKSSIAVVIWGSPAIIAFAYIAAC